MFTNRFLNSTLVFVVQLVVIVFGIMTLLFFLQRLSGDPAVVLAGHTATPEILDAIREELHLNDPLHVQYIAFIGNVLELDFGDSLRSQRPAFEMVIEQFPNTLVLGVSALMLAVVVGVPLGIYSALTYHRPEGRVVNLIAGILQSLPSFWLGLILLLIFSVQLGWVGSVANLEENFLRRMALPTLTLSAFYMGRLIRMVRSGLLDELAQPYIMTAHSKGLKPDRVFFVHALKNSLIPVVALITLDLSFLIGGSVIVESLFSYSGMGDQMVKAIFNRDFAVVQATVFVIAILVVCINTFSNFLYQLIDPRIELLR